MFCTVKFCKYSDTHVTRGHKCENCKLYGHGKIECKNNLLKDLLKEHFLDIMPRGKRCKINNCKYKVYHSYESHKRDKYIKENKDSLINDKEYIIKCPICKKFNKIMDAQKKIFGIDNKCIVCMENNIEIFLPNCGHAVLCKNCMIKLHDK